MALSSDAYIAVSDGAGPDDKKPSPAPVATLLPMAPQPPAANALAPQSVSPLIPPPLTILDPRASAEAAKLLDRLYDYTHTWFDKKGAAAGILAGVAAASIGGRTPYLANQFINGPELKGDLKADQERDISLNTAIESAVPTGLLSFNANFEVWNRVIRAAMRGDIGSEDFKRYGLTLFAISLSPITGYKQSLDAFKNYPVLKYLVGAGGILSSTGTNSLFAVKLTRNLFEKHRNSVIAKLIRGAQGKLQRLAIDEPEKFVDLLEQSKFFENLYHFRFSRTASAQTKINNLLRSLKVILETPEEDLDEKPCLVECCNHTGTTSVVYALGLLSAATYISSSFSAAADTDIFFGMSSDFTWKVVMGSLISFSAVFANGAINAIATSDSTKRWAQNMNCSCCDSPECSGTCLKQTLHDAASFFIKAYFLIGYSAAQGGMAIGYPFLKTFNTVFDTHIFEETLADDFAWGQAVLNLLLYTSIGDMAFANFYANFKNGYFASWKNLLEDAQGRNLNEYYASLKSKTLNYGERLLFNTDHQEMFIQLLMSYNRWGLDCLYDFFNTQPENIINAIVEPGLMTELEALIEDIQKDIDVQPQPNEAPAAANAPTAPLMGSSGAAPSEAKIHSGHRSSPGSPAALAQRLRMMPPPVLAAPPSFSAATDESSLLRHRTHRAHS